MVRALQLLVILALVASGCGSSASSEIDALQKKIEELEERQEVTSEIAAAPTTTAAPTTSVQATTSTTSAPTKETLVAEIPDVHELLASPVIDLVGNASAVGYDWGREWQLDPYDSECTGKPRFSAGGLSKNAIGNLELITGKDMAKVTAKDLVGITQLQFSDILYANDKVGYEVPSYVRPEGLTSYEGLEFLTCLQWLDLGIQNFGRDYRFLSSLTELRYLNLESAYEFKQVELLEPMTKLEQIVLPPSFQSLHDLVSLPSLRHISARRSRSCDIAPLLEMPELETLLLGGNSYFEQWTQTGDSGRDFDLSVDPTGRYLQLIIEGGPSTFNPEFDPARLSGIYDTQHVMNITQSIYEIAGDVYDAIVFIGNTDNHSGWYDGFSIQVGNDIGGLGAPVWSSASCFGSAGRLRGIITIPSISALWSQPESRFSKTAYGSLIHELLHLWGGGDLLPVSEDFGGNIISGHWGVSSVNGILGGFDMGSLTNIDENIFRANYFSAIGNHGLDLELSPLELYMMGVLPADEVPEIGLFRGVYPVNDSNSCEDYGYEWWDGTCFRATQTVVVDLKDIVDVFGERPYEGKLDISLLIVGVTEEPITEDEWSRIDKHISWYVEPRRMVDSNRNMWQASDGKISLLIPSIGE